MSAEVLKYTREQIEALEIAPGTEHENLEGWIPEFASDEDVRQAFEKAFDYRGDVTLTLKSGERIEAYIFNRFTGDSLAESCGWQALGRLGAEVQREEGRRRKGNWAASRGAGLSSARGKSAYASSLVFIPCFAIAETAFLSNETNVSPPSHRPS